MMETFKHVLFGKVHGLSEVYVEMILGSEDIRIGVLMEHSQRILVENEIAVDLITSTAVRF